MKRLTIEYIKEQFEKEGYKLLTEKYINNSQKLDYVCPRGHGHSISWGNWSQRKRCLYCAGNGKPTIKFIRSNFEEKGYVLLTIEYMNNSQKLDYICPNGHRHSITWGSWQQGQRCPYCAGQGRLTIEFIKSEFEKESWILKSTEYINAHQKLDCICSNGHECSITWANWQQDRRCSTCAGKAKKTIEFIRSEFEKRGCKLLTTEYINNQQKLDYICKNGHKHSIKWGHFKGGHGCPYCVGHISNEEIEVRDFVESLGIEVLANNRNQIFNPNTGNGFELDIFMPDLNKAIEYNGEYWHKNKTNNDLFKQQLCKSKGIGLLTIWDGEWKINNRKCKEKVIRFIFNDGERRRNYEKVNGC